MKMKVYLDRFLRSFVHFISLNCTSHGGHVLFILLFYVLSVLLE
jgi:hypothetical protein